MCDARDQAFARLFAQLEHAAFEVLVAQIDAQPHQAVLPDIVVPRIVMAAIDARAPQVHAAAEASNRSATGDAIDLGEEYRVVERHEGERERRRLFERELDLDAVFDPAAELGAHQSRAQRGEELGAEKTGQAGDVIAIELSAQCDKLGVITARRNAGFRKDEHVKKIAPFDSPTTRPRRVVGSLMAGAIATLCGLSTPGTRAQASRAPQLESITQEELRADLFFLASDRMQGRLTNTPTNELAADWVLSQFEGAGLKPGGHSGGFEHRYNLMTATLGEENALRLGDAAQSGPWSEYRLGEHFYPHRFSANAGVTAAPLVFVGFGIVSPERNHDDLRDAVRGRVVLMLDREPGVNDPASPFDGVVTAEVATPLRKVLAAQDKGAVGAIFVEDVHNQTGAPANFAAQAANYWPATPPRIERYTLKALSDRVRIPVIQVSEVVGRRLVAATGKSLLELAKSAETPGGITPVPITQAVTIKTSVAHQTVPDRSIVAMIEGRDPQLKNEYVLVSAHFDHDGADGPRVQNGADDDGSGTVGLIEIAEGFALAAKAGQAPRRSVIFAAWNSEERGLLGAWAYAEDPIVPLDRIVAVLNMDMIGRNEEVQVGGGGRFRGLELQTAESNNNATNIIGTVRSPDLRAAMDAANNGIGLELKYRYDNNISNLMRRSDHWPFIQKGVPGLWIHTGLHPDYHTIYDRPEKINYPKMLKITRLVYQAAWDLANSSRRPRLLPAGAPSTANR